MGQGLNAGAGGNDGAPADGERERAGEAGTLDARARGDDLPDDLPDDLSVVA
jgi:hypothetical protein